MSVIENIEQTIEKPFSRFEANLAKKESLPIFPLSTPKDGKAGVVMVGDYVAQDLVQYMGQTGIRGCWFVVSTTQSDTVPVNCSDVDFNFFTNEAGVTQYLESPAGKVAFSTHLGDGHYVDTSTFYPTPESRKKWDILYPAKYFPTKNTDVLLDAAELDPNINVAIIGWPVVSERKSYQSAIYRDHVLGRAAQIPNVTVFDNGISEIHSHTNPDGSIVIGKYSKAQMRDNFYANAKSVVFLSEKTEAINRACTEALSCDVPILVTHSNGGLNNLVTTETGRMIERSPKGILAGLKELSNAAMLRPRGYFSENFGRTVANKKLKSIIANTAQSQGREVNWEGFREYGGDLWVNHETYSKIFKEMAK